MASPRLAGIPLIVFALLPAWLASALFRTEWTHLHDNIASRYWTPVACEVIGCVRDDSIQYPDVTVRFRYKISGVTHAAAQEIACGNADEARAAIAAHPLGASTCLVDPVRPEKSMLVRDAPRGMAMNLFGAGLFGVVASVLFAGGVTRLFSRDGGVGRWPERTGQIAFGSVFTSVGVLVITLVFDETASGAGLLVPLIFGGAFASVGVFVMCSKTDGERRRAIRAAFESGDVELTPYLTPFGESVIFFGVLFVSCVLGAAAFYGMWQTGTGMTAGIAIGTFLYALMIAFLLRELPERVRAARRPRIRVVLAKTPSGEREVRWRSEGDASGYAQPSFLWVKRVRVRRGRGSHLADDEVKPLWRGGATLENEGNIPFPWWLPMDADESIRIIRLAAKDPVSGSAYSIDYSF